MRRWTAGAAALLLVVEGLVLALFGLVLGDAVTSQNMSFGGLAPGAMAVGAWVGLGLLAALMLLTAGVCVRMAVRDGSMGRPTRILLILCAVVHGVLAAVLLALSGTVPFLELMVALALLVLLLLMPPATGPDPASAPPVRRGPPLGPTPPEALPTPAP